MDFTEIYRSGEMIVPDGASCDYLIVLIYKQFNGKTVNAIGMLRQNADDLNYSVYGISLVDSKSKQVLKWGDMDEQISLGQNLRKNKADSLEENLKYLQAYNELYGKIYEFVFSDRITDAQRNMISEFMNFREGLLYPAELELCQQLSPEFFDWVAKVIV